MDSASSESRTPHEVPHAVAQLSTFGDVEPEDLHQQQSLADAPEALKATIATFAEDADAINGKINARPSLTEVPAAALASPADDESVMDSGAARSMKDLFGPFFHIAQAPSAAAAARVSDPTLVDTRAMLETYFGVHVREADVLMLGDDAAVLGREMRANEQERKQVLVQQLFGACSPAVLSKENPERFALLRAALPEPPSKIAPRTLQAWAPAKTAVDEGSGAAGAAPATDAALWLVEMPKMIPNRQTLHADPQPFFNSRCVALESDSRSLYTPQNVMRWAHDKRSNTFMSNTRVVRWSDGSSTLHVGSDMYTLDDAKGSAAVHLLGMRTTVSKGPVTLPSIMKTVHPDRHFVVESAGAASVERAIIAEAMLSRMRVQGMKLAYAHTPLPEVNWAKPSAARNPQEEYVAMAYEQRNKELLRRVKEGRPMTLREQLEADAQLYERLASANVDGLVQRQREEKRVATLNAARRIGDGNGFGSGERSRRLNRDTGLAALTGGGDPFMDDDGTRMLSRVAGSGNNGSDGDSIDDSSDEDIEEMMERMRAKRERAEAADDDDELLGVSRHAPRHEDA